MAGVGPRALWGERSIALAMLAAEAVVRELKRERLAALPHLV